MRSSYLLLAATLLETSPIDCAIAQDNTHATFSNRYLTSPPASMAGPYVIALGGYVFGAQGVNLAPFSLPTPSEIAGANVGGAAGWNFQNANLLFGFEARGLYSFAKTDHSDTSIGSPLVLPFQSGSCTSFGSNFCATNASAPRFSQPLTLQYAVSVTNRIEREQAFDVSTRFGGVVGDWLIFGRVGAGAEMIRVTQAVDTSASRLCNNPTSVVVPTGPNSGNSFVTGCGSISGGPGPTVQVSNAIAPYVTIGMGVEKNFGSYFARVEGEFLTHFAPVNLAFFGTGMYYSTQVTAGVGYRF